MVAHHVWGSRLPGRAACGLANLGNRLTRQAGKLVRALQAGAQAIGIVWNNRHGRLFSSLRVTAGLVFLAQLFAQAALNRVQFETQIFALWAALEGWYYGFQTGKG
jgi:hypothetical protein